MINLRPPRGSPYWRHSPCFLSLRRQFKPRPAARLHGNGVVSESDLSLVLSNYWPTSSWLKMTNVAGLGGTNVTFGLTNNLTGAFSVEYSTNLTEWLPLGPTTPRYEFSDTNALAQPKRFYRLRSP